MIGHTGRNNDRDLPINEQASLELDASAVLRSHLWEIFISPQQTTKFLLRIVAFLAIASLVANICHLYLPDYVGRDFIAMVFNLDGEFNIPSTYSSASILFCSILMAIIAVAQKLDGNRNYLSWIGFSLVFVYLAIDEFISIHEQLIEPLRAKFHTSGFLYYAWVIAGVIFLLVFLLVFGRFVASLPAKTRRLFIIAGTIYVGGAIGFELLGGYYANYYSEDDIIFDLLTTVEEVMEMLGIVVFIHALLSYMTGHMKGVNLGIHFIDRKKQQLISSQF
ncbi:hypothetical protein [Calothrix sp. NIES-2098]|uniref:hypothetical protein n=1 Tax=Calothrix sp. NIES-2098 TaxID=1954171 RepID=UPI000B5F53E1|nr:hypothetical protein NIES2098_38270 [Calothrix sp. NIES-2098]